MSTENTRCGYVSIIGLPNAGKSTLTNALVGAKVSIVSRKVQTTRARLLGIAMEDNAQIVLIDTPGIFAPKKTLEKAMVKAAWASFEHADALVHIVDASRGRPLELNEHIIAGLPEDTPVILALNKTDQMKKSDLLAITAAFQERFDYTSIFMISALHKQGVQDVKTELINHLPKMEWIFDPEQITDAPMRFMAAEITREKLFNSLHQELPYALFVETEAWENFRDGSIKISQVIHIERDSQKAIILGKGGRNIKKIGEDSRAELEELCGTRVHLKLFVKVQEGWAERTENYRLLGLENT